MPGPRLNVIIGADTREFGAGLGRVVGMIGRFVSVGAIVGAVRSTLDFADSLGDLADKAGVSVEWLQRSGFAATQAGASMDTLADSVAHLRRSMAEAGGGSASKQDAFGKLSISLRDLKRLTVEQTFDRIAAAVEGSNGSAQVFAATVELLGRSGRDLIPALANGFAEMQGKATELGLVLDKSIVQALGEMNDRVDQWTLKFRVALAEVVSWFKWVTIVDNAISASIDFSKGFARGGIEEGKRAWKTHVEIAREERVQDEMDLKGRAEARENLSKRSALADEPIKREQSDEGDESRGTARGTGRGGGGASRPSADALHRIGLFVGPAAAQSRMVSLQQQQLRTLREIRAAVDRNTQVTKPDF